MYLILEPGGPAQGDTITAKFTLTLAFATAATFKEIPIQTCQTNGSHLGTLWLNELMRIRNAAERDEEQSFCGVIILRGLVGKKKTTNSLGSHAPAINPTHHYRVALVTKVYTKGDRVNLLSTLKADQSSLLLSV